jgi:hypothetical protein
MKLTMKWTIALATMMAGLVSAVLITTPAEAKNTVCTRKLDGCIERCIRAQDTEKGESACVQRTCQHQYVQCAQDSGDTVNNPIPRVPRGSADSAGSRLPGGPRTPKPPREPREPRPKGGVIVR